MKQFDPERLQIVAERLLDISWDDEEGNCMACGGKLDLSNCPKHGEQSGCYGYLQTGEHDEECGLAPLLE